jgi:polar amino acid transport system substrate-binding protein
VRRPGGRPRPAGRRPEPGARGRRATGAVAALVVASLGVGLPGPVAARPLAAIRERGVLTLCAHANALPFASRNGSRPGFQVELAEALARELGVGLRVAWITAAHQVRVAACDIVLDALVADGVADERGLERSRPYHRSGVALALPPGTTGVRGFADLGPRRRVAVQMGSLAAAYLDRRGVRVVPFGFEDEMLAALARGEVDAAAVSPASIGYFNLTHPGPPLTLVHAYETEPELRWDVAVGLRQPDAALRDAVDRAVGRLLVDGTIRRIYARYGIEHRPPPGR